MSVTVIGGATVQDPTTSIVDLTTDEAIRALFPDPVIARARVVAGVSDTPSEASITPDRSAS